VAHARHGCLQVQPQALKIGSVARYVGEDFLIASVSTMTPTPCLLPARSRTVSPITGVRGVRPTIIGHDHPIDT
jgi:hypothetical protein